MNADIESALVFVLVALYWWFWVECEWESVKDDRILLPLIGYDPDGDAHD